MPCPAQDVEARRAEVRKYAGDPVYKKKVDEERRARKKKEVKQHLNKHLCFRSTPQLMLIHVLGLTCCAALLYGNMVLTAMHQLHVFAGPWVSG